MAFKVTKIDQAKLIDGVLAGVPQRELAASLGVSRPTVAKLLRDPAVQAALRAETQRRADVVGRSADARIEAVMSAAVRVACGDLTLDPVQERYSRRILGWDELPSDSGRQLARADGDGLISPATPVIVQVINQTQAKIEEAP